MTGETQHYEYILEPVLAEDGSVEAVTGSSRDITERERMEAAQRLYKRHGFERVPGTAPRQGQCRLLYELLL